MYAVVYEFEDGTVTVNGPYSSQEQARMAAQEIAKIEAEELECQYQVTGEDGTVELGEPGSYGEYGTIYPVEMGTPVSITVAPS